MVKRVVATLLVDEEELAEEDALKKIYVSLESGFVIERQMTWRKMKEFVTTEIENIPLPPKETE